MGTGHARERFSGFLLPGHPFQSGRRQPFTGYAVREEFRVLLLNAKHQVMGVHTVSIGSLTVSIVHPREVYKAAILANAAAIIGIHNHPSGNPDPSPEDHALTKRLSEAGTILGITLLDHVIIGHNTHYSFADQDQLAFPHPHPSP